MLLNNTVSFVKGTNRQANIIVLYTHATGTVSKGPSFLLVHNLKYTIIFIKNFSITNATLIREEKIVLSQAHDAAPKGRNWE